MGQKTFWNALLILAAGASIWLSSKFFVEVLSYVKLTHETQAEVKHWDVFPSGSEYAVLATYTFKVGDRVQENQYTFSKPLFPNPYAAQSSVERWKNEIWKVWFDPHHPERASLQRFFPFKSGIHMLLSLAVLCYFFWLRAYARSVTV